MKTLLFLYALLQLLAGCAKDDKASTNAQASNPGCPTLEGKFNGTDPQDGKAYSFYFGTRRDGSKTSYAISQDPLNDNTYFQSADGIKFKGTDDQGAALTRSMSCGSNSLTETNQINNDPATTVTFTDIGNGQIRVESKGDTAVLTKG